jgi:hypothetical protein
MKQSFHRKSFFCFIVVTSWAFCIGAAQVITMTGHAGCSEDTACADQQAVIATRVMPNFGPNQIGIVSMGGAFSLQEQIEVVKNEPYQAQAVTEIKQTLADGSHIVQTTTATVARDSEGRTVRIQKLSTLGPWKSSSESSQGNNPTLTSIFDPVAKAHIDYTSDLKVAHILPLPTKLASTAATDMGPTLSASSGGPVGMGANMVFSVQGRMASPDAPSGANTKTESLGTKNIEGIQATGTRTTDTIPAGSIGNDKDIVITHETWYAPDLKVVLNSTQDDPRFGQTTYSLSDIQRSEPDAALFEVPAGYKLEKIPVAVQAH